MVAMSDLDPPPGMEDADEHTASEEAAQKVLQVRTDNPEMLLADAVEQAAQE
jgi:hypothetical protein